MIDLVVKIAREKLGCDFDYEAASKFLKECFAELDDKITAFKVFDETFLTQKQLDTTINIVSQKWKEVTFDFGDGDWTISIDKVKQLNNDELEFQYKAICR